MGRLVKLVEETLAEGKGKDIDQLMDTLSNSMEDMNEKEFIDFISKSTKRLLIV